MNEGSWGLGSARLPWELSWTRPRVRASGEGTMVNGRGISALVLLWYIVVVFLLLRMGLIGHRHLLFWE